MSGSPTPPPLPKREMPPSLPETHMAPHGYRQIAKVCWWRSILFLAGMPVELRSSMVVRKPWLTWSAAILITLTTFIFWSDPESLEFLIFDPHATGITYWAGLLGYPMLHADPLHLVGNLYFLLIFGDNVECRFGRRRMLGLLVLASICGALLHAAFTDARLVGASGGIFGILIIYALMFPKSRVLWVPFGFLVALGFLVAGRSWLPKGMSVITWIVIYMLLQVVSVHEQLFMGGGVSALAHIGGGFAGAAVYGLWKRGWLP